MLNKVSAINFLSWKSLEFNINKGVTLIDGWNDDDQTSEGSGKSAILNAISWCIYGKIPKESNIDDVIKHGQQSCSVRIQIDKDVSITRTRKPNDLFMSKNIDGIEKVIKGKDARETQTLVEDYIGLSFDAFCQSVYFAQNNDKKFISSNQEERGKILSEIQDLEVFDKARKEVTELIKLENNSLQDLKTNIQLETKNLELVLNQIDHENQKYKMLESQKNTEISNLKFRISGLYSEKDRLIDRLKSLSNVLNQPLSENQKSEKLDLIDKYNSEIHEKTSLINNSDKIEQERLRVHNQGLRVADEYKRTKVKISDLESFIKNPTKNCPTCGTLLEKLDTSHAETELSLQRDTLLSCEQHMVLISNELDQIKVPDVTELKNSVLELKAHINILKKELNDIDMKERSYISAKATIDQLGTQKLELDNNIKLLENELDDLVSKPIQYDESNLKLAKSKSEEIKQKINSMSSILSEKNSYINKLEVLKSGFREIKSHIFNSVLNEINVRVSQYIDQLFNIPVKMRFINDNMKINTEITINGNAQGLGLMSGGQYRRLCLATDLAMSDVVSNRRGNKLNILVVDEYFKDLSEQSMDKCLTLLESRNQPVLLIEHNSIFKNVVNNSFLVKYSNGTSYVD